MNNYLYVKEKVYEISLMALNIGTAYGIPLPDNFVKEIPGQLTLFSREQMMIGGNAQ